MRGLAGRSTPEAPLSAISRSQLKAFRERVESEHLPAFLRGQVLPRLVAAGHETLDEHRRPAIEIDDRDGSKVPSSPPLPPTVVHGARTFWEKVTAVHAFLARKDAAFRFSRSERLSRHWYDLHALRGHELGGAALARRELRDAVIRLKSLHFAAPGVDYDRCRTAAARLVPGGELLAGLQRDHEDMIVQGMFRVDDPPPVVADLIAGIRALEEEVNAL